PVAPPEPPLKPRLRPCSGTTPALEPRSVPAPAATAAAMAAEPPRPRLGPAPACRLDQPGLSDCNGHGPAGAFVRRPAAPARTCRAYRAGRLSARPHRRAGVQQRLQELARVRPGHGRDLLGRAGGHHRAAAVAAFGAQVDDVVGRL